MMQPHKQGSGFALVIRRGSVETFFAARFAGFLTTFLAGWRCGCALLLSLAAPVVFAAGKSHAPTNEDPSGDSVASDSTVLAPLPGLTLSALERSAAAQPIRGGALLFTAVPVTSPAGRDEDWINPAVRLMDLPSLRTWAEMSRENKPPFDSPGKGSPANPTPAQLHAREADGTVNWKRLMKQTMLFLVIKHAWRFGTEPSTREDLRGPFWSDYFDSVKGLRGWRDGDSFLVNYIGHPMGGAVAGFLWVQNDARAIRQEVGFNKAYWRSRLKALGWAAVISTQFELGLLSEASLGNVGLKPSDKSKHPMGYVDLVVTPVVGTVWLVGEDLLDRYVMRRIERTVRNKVARAVIRCFINPARSFANIHRGKGLYRRDDRPLRPGP